MGSLFGNILRFSENISKDALIAIPSIAVAILLPMVIFLVEREKYPFDNMVIFEKIIRFKFFIVAIVVDVVCLVLPGQLFSLFSLGLSIIVVIITITATIRTHKWICSFDDVSSLNSYQQKKRIEYLDALKNKAEIVQTWHLVFASNEIEELNQHGLMDSLLVSIKKIEKNDDDEKMVLSMLLDEFSNNLNKFRFARRDFDEMVKYALGYYRYEVDSRKKDMNIIPPYGMKKLFWSLFAMAAADKNRHTLYAYSFFKVIEEKCGEVKQNYNDFLEILVTDLFSELDKNNIDIYKIWSGDFFRRLVITKERLMNPNTKDETVSVFKAYKNYSQRYIQSYDKKEHLQCLDMITKNVFSKIDPIFWFDINTFYESMFGSINDDIYCSMINSWCSSERSFGISGRCFSFVCEADADISEDKKKKKIKKQLEEINRAEQLETIYLLEQIFPWLTNNEEIENVKKGIKACKMLKIKDEMYNERLKKLEYDFAQIGKYNKGILG